MSLSLLQLSFLFFFVGFLRISFADVAFFALQLSFNQFISVGVVSCMIDDLTLRRSDSWDGIPLRY